MLVHLNCPSMARKPVHALICRSDVVALPRSVIKASWSRHQRQILNKSTEWLPSIRATHASCKRNSTQQLMQCKHAKTQPCSLTSCPAWLQTCRLQTNNAMDLKSSHPWPRRHMPVSSAWLPPFGSAQVVLARNLKQPRTGSSSQHFFPRGAEFFPMRIHAPYSLELRCTGREEDSNSQSSSHAGTGLAQAKLGNLDNLDNPHRSRPFCVFAFLDCAGHHVEATGSFSP